MATTFTQQSITSLFTAAILLVSFIATSDATHEEKQDKNMRTTPCAQKEKKIFAHYMGCYPLDKLPDAKEYFSEIKHDPAKYEQAIGGRHCNLALQPNRVKKHQVPHESESLNKKLEMKSEEVEAAALDIRRAIRAGIDGFSVDVLAGRERGVRTLQTLFAAAEKYDLPFEITFCLDNPYRNPAAIKLLLDQFGKSPKLARRDGKPLLFGYYSGRDAACYLDEYFQRQKNGVQKIPQSFYDSTNFKGLPQLPRDTMDFPELSNSSQLWTTPAGFAAHAKVFRHYEKQVGTPLHLQFELSDLLRSERFKGPEGFKKLKEAISVLASGFDSLGSFLPTNYLNEAQILELAKIAEDQGCEWGEALNYQYDNQLWQRYHVGKISETMRERWDMIDKTGSTLLQFTTWNDYAENTQLAPASETRYTYLELNSYFVHKWKTGKFPVYPDDRIFAIYHKYPQGAEENCHPFQVARRSNQDKPIEIITILTKPATVKLVGRDETWEAPAGFYAHLSPGTPGRVEVEVLRDDKIVKKLNCPEPIVDRIYKEQVTPTCFSTEFMKNWKMDFGDAPPVSLDGWYADKDGDGLPNWYETYWFGTFGDFDTCTAATATADLDQDGASNLDEYKNKTNPTVSDKALYSPGFKWNLINDTPVNITFNPDRDKNNNDIWFYKSLDSKSGEAKLFPDLNRKPRKQGWKIIHHFNSYDRNLYPYGSATSAAFPRSEISHEWNDKSHTITLSPSKKHAAAIAWKSPVTGTVEIAAQYSPTNPSKPSILTLIDASGNQTPLKPGAPATISLPVKKGDYLTFLAPKNARSAKLTIQDLSITFIN